MACPITSLRFSLRCEHARMHSSLSATPHSLQQQLNIVQDQVRQNQQEAAGMMYTGRTGWSSRGYPRFGTYMSYYPGFQRIAR